MALPEYVPQSTIDKLIDTINHTYQELENQINSLQPQLVRLRDDVNKLTRSDTTDAGVERRHKINNTIEEIAQSINYIQQRMKSMGGKPKINVIQKNYIDTTTTIQIGNPTTGTI